MARFPRGARLPPFGEGSPTRIDYRKKGYPYSNLSTGGPRRAEVGLPRGLAELLGPVPGRGGGLLRGRPVQPARAHREPDDVQDSVCICIVHVLCVYIYIYYACMCIYIYICVFIYTVHARKLFFICLSMFTFSLYLTSTKSTSDCVLMLASLQVLVLLSQLFVTCFVFHCHALLLLFPLSFLYKTDCSTPTVTPIVVSCKCLNKATRILPSGTKRRTRQAAWNEREGVMLPVAGYPCPFFDQRPWWVDCTGWARVQSFMRGHDTHKQLWSWSKQKVPDRLAELAS